MRYLAILIIFNLLLAVPAANAENKTLTFTTGDDRDDARTKAMKELLTTCFNRMNIKINIIPMPSERSLYNANAGTQDGNFLRTEGISKSYPNLIMVPEPFYVNTIVAFSHNKNIKIDGWKSLLPYRVVWVKGWKNCDRELSKAKSVTRVRSEKALFLFLAKERADVGVFGLSTGSAMLKKLGITNVYPLSPAILLSNLYLYIHIKHISLIPQIVKTLQEMKYDGTYEKITNKYKSIKPTE
ncbi:polar amino acid transport system substrate-binding protein [Maridesulfovibrio ferrireducens]|uniref:Polar amino acid transport system substrate-binding protein n=1 Tax=Maridesulfovibrio ferrireducens TaxID=246191 RepID=A0A1G9D7B5_9BACT|nr:transporter substrate-binding domain-containing protein [Maridesulfovibrio ferrireducens]SDK59777.1 polar amino acid transport system substrate-binding protein [Maridesulfovibrio ferrireducens]